MSQETHESDEQQALDPFTIRVLWFVPCWYIAYTTALMDLSRQVTVPAFALLIFVSMAVSAYASEA